ncbi:hypothetical protein [Cupriavidus sp. CuC1]
MTLFDAVIHADIGPRWRLQLNASNLFNKAYVAGEATRSARLPA